jgi:hypothetical protein
MPPSNSPPGLILGFLNSPPPSATWKISSIRQSASPRRKSFQRFPRNPNSQSHPPPRKPLRKRLPSLPPTNRSA